MDLASVRHFILSTGRLWEDADNDITAGQQLLRSARVPATFMQGRHPAARAVTRREGPDRWYCHENLCMPIDFEIFKFGTASPIPESVTPRV